MKRLEGEVALVTGGSSGIGLALGTLLCDGGARVYLAARNRERLEAAARGIGGDARVIAADLSEPSGAAALAAGLREAGEDRLDLLVNCAGQFEIGRSDQLGGSVARDLTHANFLSAVYAIDALLPLLRQGTRRSIVNVSSLAGRMAPPFMGAYAASKFALNGYTLALRQELRTEGFHVALVSPGPVLTPMIEERVRSRQYPVPPGIPIIAPERVARAIVRLILRRRAERTVPAWLGPVARAAAALPGAVDLVYRMTVLRRGDRYSAQPGTDSE